MVWKESRGFLTPPAWRRRREEKRRRRGSEHLNRRRSLHCAVSGARSAVTEQLRRSKQTPQRRKHRPCSRLSAGSSGAEELRTRYPPLEATVSVTDEDVLWAHHRRRLHWEDPRTVTCSPERRSCSRSRSRRHARLRLQVPGEAEAALPVSALQQGHAGAGAGLHLWTPLLWHLSARIPQVRRARVALCIFICMRVHVCARAGCQLCRRYRTPRGFGWGRINKNW